MNRAEAEARADDWIQARCSFGYSVTEVTDLILSVQEEANKGRQSLREIVSDTLLVAMKRADNAEAQVASVARVVRETRMLWEPYPPAVAACDEIKTRLGLEG